MSSARSHSEVITLGHATFRPPVQSFWRLLGGGRSQDPPTRMRESRRGVMIGDKTEHFQGKGTDLNALQTHIVPYLESDGFTVHIGIG